MQNRVARAIEQESRNKLHVLRGFEIESRHAGEAHGGVQGGEERLRRVHGIQVRVTEGGVEEIEGEASCGANVGRKGQ